MVDIVFPFRKMSTKADLGHRYHCKVVRGGATLETRLAKTVMEEVTESSGSKADAGED